MIKRTVTILNTKTGKPLFVYKGHGDSSFWSLHGVSCLAYDQTGMFIATGGHQGNIHIWSSRTGKELVNVKGHNKHVLSRVWSPNGAYLATVGSDEFVKMWRSTTGEEVFMRKQEAEGLSFSPDGKMLAINRGSHFELWRIQYNSSHGHEEPSMELYNTVLLPYFFTDFKKTSLAWSHDGRFLAVSNGSVVVYDMVKGESVLRMIPTGQFRNPTDLNKAAHTLAFNPDGKSIIIGTNEGIYRYPVVPKEK